MTAETVSLAASTSAKMASSVTTASGAGSRRAAILVATPSVPSEPVKSPRRS